MNKMVLVVDDNPNNRKLLGELLHKNDYEVGVCENANEMFSFLEKKHPNIILLDIMMPGMNGFDACIKLKENSSVKNIPVIFITAKNNQNDINKGFKVGGVDYVTKPFNHEELLARIRTHIEISYLRGLIPICSNCNKIRDDKGYWKSIEEYLSDYGGVELSHSLCPVCAKKLYGNETWFDIED